MGIADKLSDRFAGVEGGLFTKVTKADVGDGFASMESGNVTLMGWADPFYPDPSIPENIINVVTEAYKTGFPSHYTMPIGSLELREEIAKKCKVKNSLDIDPKRNVLITPGSDSGLFFSMMPLLNAGDEVLVPDPSYPNNFLDPKLLGAKVVPFALKEEEGYQLNFQELEEKVTEKTKLVLLTHPNNPTTTVFRKENLQKLAEFVIKHDLFLVVDQAFEDMVYDDIDFVTPAALPGMWERTVTVFSISKGMGLSGFRVGYVVACDTLMDLYYGAAVGVIGATNTAAQIGAIAAFKDDSFMDAYYEEFNLRRQDAFEVFSKVPGIKLKMSESGFFSWINVSGLGNSAEITEYLIHEAGVAVNDGINYGTEGNGYLRIIHGCLGDRFKAKEVLEKIAKALIDFTRK